MMNDEKAWDFSDLQREQAPWTRRNFGDRPAWMPLLGIVEEIGELSEAGDQDEVIDACADTVVFMGDFCNSMGFDDFEGMRQLALETSLSVGLLGHALVLMTGHVGRLCHSYLKLSQGIRGTPEEHRGDMRNSIVELLRDLHLVARLHLFENSRPFDLREETGKVWSKVRQRVWRCQREGCEHGLPTQGTGMRYCGDACKRLVETGASKGKA